MRKLCCSLEKHSSSSSSCASISEFPFGSSPSRLPFADSVMNRTLGMAEPIIMKWNPETTTVVAVTSMFYENRREAGELIQSVSNLQKAMRLVVMENINQEKLVSAQNLMQIAMKRLQKEFYQILSMNRAHLDPESVSTWSSRVSNRSSTSGYEEEEEDDDIRIANQAISEVEDASRVAMADLRSIAECMISCGYGNECVKVYKIIRKSIVDEGIYRLGVEKFNASNIPKMNWEVLDLRIKSWLNALETAVKTLFDGERALCDHVFASSDSFRESCFTEVTSGGAMILFGFPENVVKNSRRFPEKVFRALDMYAGISTNLPEIESIFSFDSTENIKSMAMTSLITLSEYVKAALNDFESAIQKESSKTPAGAGIHDLTIKAMNYLSLLADYRNMLNEIFPESPPPEQNLLPESYLGLIDPYEQPPPPMSFKIAWLILAVLCRLDAKSKFFEDISLYYLFLANNLQYVVVKVRASNLRQMLGDKWLSQHEYKVKHFTSCYERLGWSHVVESLPSDPSSITCCEQIKETFKKFNLAFDEVCSKQSLCVVTDNCLREDIKESLARKIFCSYREFYDTHGRTMYRDRNSAFLVRFTPEDVGHRLSDLFFGHDEPGISLSFNSYVVTQSATR